MTPTTKPKPKTRTKKTKPEPPALRAVRCQFGHEIVDQTGKAPGYDGPDHCPECAAYYDDTNRDKYRRADHRADLPIPTASEHVASVLRQPLDARAHAGDGGSSAREAGAALPDYVTAETTTDGAVTIGSVEVRDVASGERVPDAEAAIQSQLRLTLAEEPTVAPTPGQLFALHHPFDAANAMDEIFRKNKTVEWARRNYQTAKDDAAHAKKLLDRELNELSALIDKHEAAQREASAPIAAQEPTTQPPDDPPAPVVSYDDANDRLDVDDPPDDDEVPEDLPDDDRDELDDDEVPA